MPVLIQHQKLQDKLCVICQEPFQPRSGIHKFCSSTCKEKQNQLTGSMSVEKQYERISGNWGAYFTRLITAKRKEDGLTTQDLLFILQKQDYKCALTGIRLTCLLELGTVCKTNASIDRLEAGGLYCADNIQLVCRAVNSFRNDLDLSTFIWWCKQVAAYSERKE